MEMDRLGFFMGMVEGFKVNLDVWVYSIRTHTQSNISVCPAFIDPWVHVPGNVPLHVITPSQFQLNSDERDIGTCQILCSRSPPSQGSHLL